MDEVRRGDGDIQMTAIRADWVGLHNTLPVVASNPTRGSLFVRSNAVLSKVTNIENILTVICNVYDKL